MGLRINGVVAVQVVGQSAKAGLVQRIVMLANRPEPRLDILTHIELSGHTNERPRVAPIVLLSVPHFTEPLGTLGLSWRYPGPEVLVRGPVNAPVEGL